MLAVFREALRTLVFIRNVTMVRLTDTRHSLVKISLMLSREAEIKGSLFPTEN